MHGGHVSYIPVYTPRCRLAVCSLDIRNDGMLDLAAFARIVCGSGCCWVCIGLCARMHSSRSLTRMAGSSTMRYAAQFRNSCPVALNSPVCCVGPCSRGGLFSVLKCSFHLVCVPLCLFVESMLNTMADFARS